MKLFGASICWQAALCIALAGCGDDSTSGAPSSDTTASDASLSDSNIGGGVPDAAGADTGEGGISSPDTGVPGDAAGPEVDTVGPLPDAGPEGPPPDWFKCASDADCVVAFADCCDACNGGKPVAARPANAAEVQAWFEERADTCGQCGTLPCPAQRAYCKTGTCAMRFETNVEGGCTGFGPEDCDASPVCKRAQGVPLAEHCDPAVTDNPIELGCVLSTSCFDIDTCARHPEGFISMVFADSCYPAGWTPCGPSFCQELIPKCTLGLPPPKALYCVRGEPVEEGELLAAGVPLQVNLRPDGCFSQTCTLVYEAECGSLLFEADAKIAMQGSFCFTLNAQVTCAGDCLGGAPVPCGEYTLEPGLYTLLAKGMQKSFTVPSIVPAGGLCVEILAPAL